MTVRNSPRSSTNRSPGLPQIPEEQDLNIYGPGSDSNQTSRPRSPQSSSHPTEYNQSYRTRGGPRPRNPVTGWQARNLSNILPSEPGAPAPLPSRASRRPPPELWLARHAESQIFPAPDPPPRPPPQNGDNTPDVNNNPRPPPPIVAGGRRRTGRWPWQTRAQSSSIFLTGPENAPIPQRPLSAYHKYPWQERAHKSVIFEVLTGQDIGPKRKLRRTYEWDQRQSNLVTDAVQQKQDPSSTSNKTRPQDSTMPWKERAMQSVVFSSPDKPSCPRPVNHAWDQRRSRFSVLVDPTAQFSKGSSYKDNYVKWQTTPDGKGLLKAAGKPCYTFDDIKDENGKPNQWTSPSSGKRRFKSKSGSTSSGSHEIIPLPQSKADAQTSPRKSTSAIKTVKGQTCLEIVPLGYRFSNCGITKSDSRVQK